jgi:peptidoglycan hydrolase-like protein with peptidoglycan-binding domain
MLLFRASLGIVLTSALVAAPALASRVHRASASTHSRLSTTARSHKGHIASRKQRLRGQQVIEPSRVTEIQQALIREHYFSGEANGQWDATTQAAMQKYQADQGWQTKLMPDSRALKRLGLGADYSTAINAKTASFAEPPPISTIPAPQAAGFAAAAGTDHESSLVNKTN